MKSSTINLDQIRRAGIEALARELGPIGMVRFLQQFETGSGDYTLDRHEWLGRLDITVIARKIRQRRKR